MLKVDDMLKQVEDNTFADDYLDLSDQSVRTEGALRLAQALEKHADSCPITRINLTKSYIGVDAVKAIASALTKNHRVTELDLSENDLKDDSAEALAPVTTLKGLILRGNNFTSKGAAVLTTAVARSLPLQKLDLSMNNIGNKGVAPLVDNHSLTECILDECGLGVKGAESLAKLASHGQLRTLSLNRNLLGNTGVAHFKGNKTLKNFSLSQNILNDESAPVLAGMALDKLDLRTNHFHDEGVHTLATKNATLVELNLAQNDTSSKDKVKEILSGHPKLTTLALDWGPPISFSRDEVPKHETRKSKEMPAEEPDPNPKRQKLKSSSLKQGPPQHFFATSRKESSKVPPDDSAERPQDREDKAKQREFKSPSSSPNKS